MEYSMEIEWGPIDTLIETLKKELNLGSDREKIEGLCYNIFFHEHSTNIPGNLWYYLVGVRLTNNDIVNKIGESDSFGPLSWGVHIPNTDRSDKNNWVWFG